MITNQAIPKYEADQVILRLADGIESDIDEILTHQVSGFSDDGFAAVRVAEFLNAVLCSDDV